MHFNYVVMRPVRPPDHDEGNGGYDMCFWWEEMVASWFGTTYRIFWSVETGELYYVDGKGNKVNYVSHIVNAYISYLAEKSLLK